MGAHGTAARLGGETCYIAVAFLWYDPGATDVSDARQQEPETAMATMPEPVARLLETALVGELTVIDRRGRPVTYPLIPLWDGERIYLTSSTLFSRKLEHIRANPRVALSITDPVAVDGALDRVTIQGDARVIEEDPHGGWERLLPIWERKEPAIVAFLKQRVALPLFFERALIEITPRRAFYWSDGNAATEPLAVSLEGAA